MSWITKWFEDIKRELKELWNKITGGDTPTTTTTPPVGTTPPPVEGDVDLSKADWKKINGSKAKVTQQLTSMAFDGKYFRMTTSEGTKNWTPFKDDCNQYSCFFVQRNGIWTGGKFDWQRPSNSPRSTKNILSGYTDGVIPVKGEKVAYCQINLNCTERTNCRIVTWK